MPQQLIDDTLRELPQWATVAAAEADGYTSIGDAGTGSEHFIKQSLIQDDVMLDPTQPESLVYTVKGDTTHPGRRDVHRQRPPHRRPFAHRLGRPADDMAQPRQPVLGPRRRRGQGGRHHRRQRQVRPRREHRWREPDGARVDHAPTSAARSPPSRVSAPARLPCPRTSASTSASEHDHATTTRPPPTPKPYDPTQPIDLSGFPGVTPEQQAAAENLVAVTLVRLPQWSDYKVAEAAGFHSIGDALTGHEHFINWDWINDDITLDPDHPESLVYQPQPDGSKKLVSAMYMLPDTVTLEDVPDIGGALMQWHIHDNLCFTDDPVAPRVAGITNGTGGCNATAAEVPAGADDPRLDHAASVALTT